MAVIGAETLTVVGEPDVANMVVGLGKEEVTSAIELDLGEGPFVACARCATQVYERERERRPVLL